MTGNSQDKIQLKCHKQEIHGRADQGQQCWDLRIVVPPSVGLEEDHGS